jgi:hypothetical protein
MRPFPRDDALGGMSNCRTVGLSNCRTRQTRQTRQTRRTAYSRDAKGLFTRRESALTIFFCIGFENLRRGFFLEENVLEGYVSRSTNFAEMHSGAGTPSAPIKGGVSVCAPTSRCEILSFWKPRKKNTIEHVCM